MDNNNFENNGFEPQKPFTEREDKAQNLQNEQPVQSNPEAAYQQNPVQPENRDYTSQAQNVTTNPNPNPTPNVNPPYQGYNDYSHPTYNNYNSYNPNPQNQPPYYGAQQYYPPHNNVPPYQPYGYQPPQKPPKKIMSTGLVVFITLMCVLLALGLVGIVSYVISSVNSNNNAPDLGGDKPYSYSSPYGFTLPEPTTEPAASEHKESDYSDKINSDFSGLKLSSKPKDSASEKYTSEYANNQASNSVVGVVCYKDEITTVDDCASQGSGIIITADGYVVTNSHVIGNSKTAYAIQVVLSDGTAYDAGVVGFDTRTDLAVLKMDNAKNLKAATFGDSNSIELGEDVIVIGNPGGLAYSNSITKGVVSAVDRKLSTKSMVKYIQTDAAINPGNSGGPVVNMYGQVVGIATAKIASTMYEGMGFAIPSQDVKKVVDSLVKEGYVEGRVKIGIMGNNITSSMASEYNVPRGIIIQEIIEGGPCDGSGLKAEDIITGADGKKVQSFSDIYEILEDFSAGDEITLEYYRPDDGSTDTVTVILQEDK